MHVMYISLVN